jgi:hypothetical protein
MFARRRQAKKLMQITRMLRELDAAASRRPPAKRSTRVSARSTV